jgi:polysaccharide deacetylase family protein (PEP-CTERM system associated)
VSGSLGSPGRVLATVDVEDWPQSTWDRSLPIGERAARNTENLLDLLGNLDKRVTMFVLGKFGERFPKVVQRIAREGHEVASHGYGHVEIFRQTPEVFRQDILRAKKVLEDILGAPVLGYRAPDFSVMPGTSWALEILAETGHQYDSSIFPIRHRRYGFPGWPAHPTRVRLRSGNSIMELPIGTVRAIGRRWPAGGGGYHRLLPGALIQWAVGRSLREQGVFVAYCHPYEFDPLEFRELNLAIPLRIRLHQGLGRRGFRGKFERLLGSFGTVQGREVAREARWPVVALDSGSSNGTHGVAV